MISEHARPTGSKRQSRRRPTRSTTDALLAGVAGGLGQRWGVDPVLVRIAFVVLTFAGGVGLFAYLLAWAISEDPDPDAEVREPTTQQAVAFAAIVTGVVLLLREAGLWFGDAVGVPLGLAAVGAALIYVRADPVERQRWTRGARDLPLPRPSLVRVILGGSLVVGGMGTFLATSEGFSALGVILLAMVATTAGLAVALGPWVWRLVSQLAEERRDRIRSEERAEVAAHLHDSVLQTLALIQRNSGNPRKMVSLARRQERELRAWLYGGQLAPHDQLSSAIQAMAQSVEEAHDVPVDVVMVGDYIVDEGMLALVAACREAATNAARHSGADRVTVYVECEPETVTAFVRDAGRGFDPAAVPPDRRGIRNSIHERAERHGGTVTITSDSREGTEVQIQMPVMGS